MRRLRHAATALGLLAPACAPATTHRGRTAPTTAAPAPQPETADSRPDDVEPAPTSSAPATTTTEAPTTTVVTITVPSTPRRTTTTFVVPERADEDMGDVEWLIRQTFPETPDKAVGVARCESRLNPRAVNGQHIGVMQVATQVHAELIADMGYEPADLLDLAVNLRVARAVYDGKDGGPKGWAAWTCAA